MVQIIPLFDNRISVTDCPDFEGKRCLLMTLKMPMMITDRSIVALYYQIDKPDGSMVTISSSQGTEAVVEAQKSVIKKNVVANSIINYLRFIPREGGCDFHYVQSIDIAGSIPNYLKK